MLGTLILAASLLAAGGAAADSGLVAYVNEAGEIHTVQSDGTKDRTLATVGESLQPISFSPVAEGRDFFTWPAWSPDAKRIAAFRVSSKEQAIVDSLYVLDVESSHIVERYERPGLRPIYAYWSPNGERLAMLLQLEGSGFSLSLWPQEASDRPKSLAVGVPFFYDWSRKADRLLLHVGNDPDSPAGHSVTLLDIASGDRRPVSKTPAVFGPASWSADGKWMAYATLGEKNESKLVIADAEGKEIKSSVKVSPRVAFNWSPKGSVLAVAMTNKDEDPVYQQIQLIDAETGKARSLRKEPISSFFWSPDGKNVLLATRDLESGAWQWVVVDAKTKEARKLGRFFPSRPQLMVFQYFDQYALSHRLWSPDGTKFVFSGAIENDPASPHPILSPKVYVADLRGKAAPKAIAEGHTAFWSPK